MKKWHEPYSAWDIIKDVLILTVIVGTGVFAISAAVLSTTKPVDKEVVIKAVDSTENQINQVAADVDTIGIIIDSIEAKLDSLALYREMN